MMTFIKPSERSKHIEDVISILEDLFAATDLTDQEEALIASSLLDLNKLRRIYELKEKGLSK